jgi:DNA-binding NarL/FixJ family response regulator/two-component sensor histidine kinase
MRPQQFEITARDIRREELLERQVLAIADREKERLGRELHDGVCQSLAGIAALTKGLSRRMAASAQPGPAAEADEIVQLLSEAIGEVRHLARCLGPVSLNGAGLVGGLEALARNVSHMYRASCKFVWDGHCPGLCEEAVTHLMRIAQEAVRNAVAHGRADHIDICLECAEGSGLLSIRDNGVGLSEDVRDHHGIGLHTMNYRARAIGGALTLSRRPEGGTVVACAFPPASPRDLPMTAPTADPAGPARKMLLLVDDHPILRRGLTALIESEPGFAVSGAAGTRLAALKAIAKSQPDLVIVDLALGDDDGLDLVKEIKARYPKVPSLVLSMHDEEVYAERALSAGALGYVVKQEVDETVLGAIRRVLAGDRYMSEALQRRLAERYVGGRTLERDSPIRTLSDRELHVFRLVGQGRTTRQIAMTLSRSVKTIESHLEHIKNKLGLESAAELAHRATLWVETGPRRLTLLLSPLPGKAAPRASKDAIS